MKVGLLMGDWAYTLKECSQKVPRYARYQEIFLYPQPKTIFARCPIVLAIRILPDYVQGSSGSPR